MKNIIRTLFFAGIVFGSNFSEAETEDVTKVTMKTQMTITIGQETFTATLANNETAAAFKAMLPLTLMMSDLNKNEKVIRLSDSLPSDDASLGDIQTGDLMLWESKHLVLFYKSFLTPYRYTRLGRIGSSEGLSAAVGKKDVMIKFEME